MHRFALPKPFYRLPLELDLSRAAKRRLAWIDFYHDHQDNARLTCRHFGISPTTFYLWLHRFNPRNHTALEDRSRRPRRLRQSTLPQATVAKVIALRKQFPAWSKYKLAVLLRQREGITLSPSTLGRLFHRHHLFLPKPRNKYLRRLKRRREQPPKSLYRTEPGSLIQLDTKHLRFSDGSKAFQFTAIDTCTRLRVLRAFSTASSKAAERFLQQAQEAFPFPLQNLNTDNGSEFLGFFEQACTKANLPHFFSAPHCPKQNGLLERSHRTDDEEFYHLLQEEPQTVADLDQKLRQWERCYNTLRPHAALGYLTPLDYLNKLTAGDPKPPTKVSRMY